MDELSEIKKFVTEFKKDYLEYGGHISMDGTDEIVKNFEMLILKVEQYEIVLKEMSEMDEYEPFQGSTAIRLSREVLGVEQ